MKALGAIAGVPWAIQESWLEVLCAIAAREDPNLIASLEALQGRGGRGPRDRWSGPSSTREGGVRVIEVVGPIFRRADFFTSISGATDTATLARAFAIAADDPEVTSILLEIDSPGGEAAGIAEFASMIHAARERKPVVAYADDLCCSGAYWLASACSRIVAAPTATLGSIGVVMVHHDTKEMDKRRGITRREFVSSQSPNKRPDMETDAGRAQVQKWVDDLAAVFVRDVARYRAVEESAVLEDYGAGGVMVGEHAVAAGLADGLGSFEALVSEYAAPTRHIVGGGFQPTRLAPTVGPQAAAEERKPMAEQQEAQVGEDRFLARLARAAFNFGHTGADAGASGGQGPPQAGGSGSGNDELQRARVERDQQRERADQAEAALTDLRGKVCGHFHGQIAHALTQLGEESDPLIAAGLQGLAASGDWEQLATTAETCRKRVLAKFPAGTSADPKVATKPPEGKPTAEELAAEAKGVVARRRGVVTAANGNGGKR